MVIFDSGSRHEILSEVVIHGCDVQNRGTTQVPYVLAQRNADKVSSRTRDDIKDRMSLVIKSNIISGNCETDPKKSHN